MSMGGHGRLAEQVDRRPVDPQGAQRSLCACRRLGHDEAAGHVTHAAGGRRAQRGPPRARPPRLHRRGQRRWGLGHLLEEAGQVRGEVVERPAGRGDVDEAKQRGSQLGGCVASSIARSSRACSGR